MIPYLKYLIVLQVALLSDPQLVGAALCVQHGAVQVADGPLPAVDRQVRQPEAKVPRLEQVHAVVARLGLLLAALQVAFAGSFDLRPRLLRPLVRVDDDGGGQGVSHAAAGTAR